MDYFRAVSFLFQTGSVNWTTLRVYFRVFWPCQWRHRPHIEQNWTFPTENKNKKFLWGRRNYWPLEISWKKNTNIYNDDRTLLNWPQAPILLHYKSCPCEYNLHPVWINSGNMWILPIVRVSTRPKRNFQIFLWLGFSQKIFKIFMVRVLTGPKETFRNFYW